MKKWEKEISNLPPPLQKILKKTAERLEKYGLKEKEIIKEIKARIKEFKKIKYTDKRFNLFDKDYVIYSIFSLISQILNKKIFCPEEFKKIGRLFFDLNGLKTINDLTTHQIGDKFLKRVALTIKNGETSQWLAKKMKIKTIVASEGGDEFSVLLIDKKPLDRLIKVRKNKKTKKIPLIDLILEKYKKEIEKINFSDIFDFSEERIRKKLGELSVPSGFKFKAILNGGRATLYEAWEKIKNNSTTKKIPFSLITKKIASSFFDLTDERAKKDKKIFKNKISNSRDPKLKFLALIYQRNEENYKLERENQKLKEKHRHYQNIISQLKKEVLKRKNYD